MNQAQAAWEQASLRLLVRACLKGQLSAFQALGLAAEDLHPRWRKLAETFQELPPDVDALPGLAGVDMELAKTTMALAADHEFAVAGQSLRNLADALRKAELNVGLTRAWGDQNISQALEIIERLRQEGEPGGGGIAALDFDALRASRFIDHDPSELHWLFEKSMLEGTVGFLCGPPGAGKSTFLIELAGCIATGTPLLDDVLTPAKKGKVLAFFCEDKDEVLHPRVSRIFKHFNQPGWDDAHAGRYLTPEDFGGNFIPISCVGQDMRLMESVRGGDPQPSQAFYDLLRRIKEVDDLALIILDPLSRLYGQNENDNSSATLFASLLERLAVETGACVICSHHVGKHAGKDNKGEFDLDVAMDPDVIRGASALTGACRWQCNLFGLPEKAARKLIGDPEAESGQYLAAKVCKKNYGPPEDMFFLVRKYGGALERVTPTVAPTQDVDPALEEWVIQKVQDSDRSGIPLTIRGLRSFAPELKDIGASGMGAQAAADRLVFNGDLFLVPAKNARNMTIERLTAISPSEEGLVDANTLSGTLSERTLSTLSTLSKHPVTECNQLNLLDSELCHGESCQKKSDSLGTRANSTLSTLSTLSPPTEEKTPPAEGVFNPSSGSSPRLP
ncbi:MAG: AAA family ATPase [Desulfovibrionaceae bacterium]